MILTAREPAELRREVLKMGISQIDGGSSIGIGSYSQEDPEKIKRSQFVLGDNRSLEEIIQDLIKEGYIPHSVRHVTGQDVRASTSWSLRYQGL